MKDLWAQRRYLSDKIEYFQQKTGSEIYFCLDKAKNLL